MLFLFDVVVSVISEILCFNNCGFIFLSTVSLLCSILSPAPSIPFYIFSRFGLLDIHFLGSSLIGIFGSLIVGFSANAISQIKLN